jgi:hypothetical protein
MLRIVNKDIASEESAHPSWGTLKGETVSKEQGICCKKDTPMLY